VPLPGVRATPKQKRNAKAFKALLKLEKKQGIIRLKDGGMIFR
jgi:hypothetical protein